MEEKLKNIFSELFKIDKNTVNPNSSINNIERWSSLMHFKLIAMIEEEFKINFNEEEFIRLTSFAEIVKVLSKKVNR